MTTLRDDGYLETDDPVVAACFMGRDICGMSCNSDRQEAYDIETFYLRSVDTSGGCSVNGIYCYPLLIPASTVAEVWGLISAAFLLLCGIESIAMFNWIRKHTEDTDAG